MVRSGKSPHLTDNTPDRQGIGQLDRFSDFGRELGLARFGRNVVVRRTTAIHGYYRSPLQSHWDHDAVADRGSTAQQVAILVWSLFAAPQARRIGRFRTTDDCAKATQQFMFCNEPIGATIPPRYRRKRSVKSNARQRSNRLPSEPWCPCQKPAIGNTLSNPADQMPP